MNASGKKERQAGSRQDITFEVAKRTLDGISWHLGCQHFPPEHPHPLSASMIVSFRRNWLRTLPPQLSQLPEARHWQEFRLITPLSFQEP